MAFLQTVCAVLGCHGIPDGRIYQGMARVSDDGLLRYSLKGKFVLPGETDSGSAGTQPEKG
jgi:hypothetical protein